MHERKTVALTKVCNHWKLQTVREQRKKKWLVADVEQQNQRKYTNSKTFHYANVSTRKATHKKKPISIRLI